MKFKLSQSDKKNLITGLCVAATAGVWYVDLITGVQFNLAIFYLVPVVAASWASGLNAGLLIASLSAASWFLDDSVLSPHYYDYAFIAYWNALVKFAFFLAAALAANKIKSSLDGLRAKNEELAEAYEALDRAAKEKLETKDRVLSHVSHELKTPLSALHGFVSLVRDEVTGPLNDEQKECLDGAMRNAASLNSIINDLLDAARAESGKLAFALKTGALDETLEEAARAMRPLAEEKGVSLSLEIEKGIQAGFDASRIRQVVINLIGNAVKFTPEGGGVIVRARRGAEAEADAAVVCVVDDGPGIAKEEQKKLFQRLYQAQGPADDSRKGLGLGLYISKEIINRHKGRIWVESEEGKGSAFYFSLPKAAQDAGAAN
jgi:signal transduction histidine kinase